MGFFDRFKSRPAKAKPRAAASVPPSAAPAPAAEIDADPAPAPVASGPIAPQLEAARACLEAHDLPGALAIYEPLLEASGDRPDVLVTVSGDLGSHGHVQNIVELIAPRYDAERHGPATGLNVLQAYLNLRNAQAAQHVLDLLFALRRPELEARLWGFSNALAELIEAQRVGNTAQAGAGEGTNISLVTISKPIWAYGIADIPGVLPPKDVVKRSIAFGQLATPGLPKITEAMAAPEDDLGRFTRGFPLWLAETLYACPHYNPVAAIGLTAERTFALFGGAWTAENVQQVVASHSEPLDFVVTGNLEQKNADYHLSLKLWEIKKFRELKSFEVDWTPNTVNQVLLDLHEQLCRYLEWAPYPEGTALTYRKPVRPVAWIRTLGTSLATFLAEQSVLPTTQLGPLPKDLTPAEESENASLARLTLDARARRLGLAAPALGSCVETPLVAAARQALG